MFMVKLYPYVQKAVLGFIADLACVFIVTALFPLLIAKISKIGISVADPQEYLLRSPPKMIRETYIRSIISEMRQYLASGVKKTGKHSASHFMKRKIVDFAAKWWEVR